MFKLFNLKQRSGLLFERTFCHGPLGELKPGQSKARLGTRRVPMPTARWYCATSRRSSGDFFVGNAMKYEITRIMILTQGRDPV